MKHNNILFFTGVLSILVACGPQKAISVERTATVSADFHGTDMRQEVIGGSFTMTGSDNKPFHLSSLKGKVVILSFGYTHCPDVCPIGLLTYSDVLKQLGSKADNVAVVFASVDPDRDTPELLGKYTKQFHPKFIGLTVTGSQNLQHIKQQYRVVSAKAEQQSDKVYLVDHSVGTYLLDKNGKVAVFAPYGSTAQQIAEDILILLQS